MVSAGTCSAEPAARRAAWLQEFAGLPKAQATRLAGALSKAKDENAVLAALESERAKGTKHLPKGEYVLQPGTERRRTSAHYTPKSLTTPIVRKTLEPILRALGNAPTSEQLLSLKICDPAMGSGAFLVEVCRFLADQVVGAWSRENKLDALRGSTDDVALHARRLVAQRCLYGVDLNPFAVTLARLSLWLFTLAKDQPFTFVDHALRHGDALVGLTLEQLRAFHWTPPEQLELGNIAREVDAALEEARGFREQILALAEGGAETSEEKERLLRDAEFALERARIVGDLVVGAFFAHVTDKDRKRALFERLEQVRAWFDGDGELPAQLKVLRDELRRHVTPFHWSIEYPEVFYTARPDPLEKQALNGAAFMDSFLGNTPFAGKNTTAEKHGDRYIPWLQVVHPGAHGNADYCAHFFRRAFDLLGANGTLGFIATNTICQGDTRATSLHFLVTQAGQRVEIFDAVRSLTWPGVANVAVSVVHVVKGKPDTGAPRLDGQCVPAINCRLRAKPERPDPVALAENADKSFQGSIVLGMGFTLTPDERSALIKKNKKNAQRIFPYLGGEEVNSSPTQDVDRYVINFGAMALEEAEGWPDLVAIVREKVKPERDRNNREFRKKYWWRFGEPAPALYETIAPLKRCLVNSRVTKHLVFAFQPTDRVFAESLYAYPFSDYAHFAVLQSRIHESWARLLSSTLEDRLRYAASDCFETFPFPHQATIEPNSNMERAGKALYETRAQYLIETQQGLTTTYNQLKDPHCTARAIEKLRRLHEEMDRAVLKAYGWQDLDVPPYGTGETSAQRQLHAQFEDEVIDRLFALNSERAAEERSPGLVKTKRAAAATVAPIVHARPAKRVPVAKRSAAQKDRAERGPGPAKSRPTPPSPARKTASTGAKRQTR